MGWWKEKLPIIAMVFEQSLYAITSLLTRASLVKGMNPTVFFFYKQVIATLFISPFAFFGLGQSATSSSMGVKSFLLIFVTSSVVVLSGTLLFQGLFLTSSSTSTAMTNVVPAMTFFISAILRLEQVSLRRLSSIAKIIGTMVCVGGAISMALLKGPKLLNAHGELPTSYSLVFQSLESSDYTWFLGCLYLFGALCCQSFVLILLAIISAFYSDHISITAWVSFLTVPQAGAIVLLFERDLKAWNLTSKLELTCCLFSGIFGSGVILFIQSWCVLQRGPVFSAMFNPLCAIFTTALASIFLHEQIYLGSLLGGVAVIIGLYVVLWGKSEELKAKQEVDSQSTKPKTVQEETSNYKVDLEQPLLKDQIIQA